MICGLLSQVLIFQAVCGSIKICKYIENICCFFRYVCDSRNCKSNSKNDASAYFLLRAAEPFQRNTYSEKGQKFAWQQEEGVQWPFVARFTQPCICRASSRGVEIGNSKLVEAKFYLTSSRNSTRHSLDHRPDDLGHLLIKSCLLSNMYIIIK